MTDPQRILLSAFEITAISRCDQRAWLRRSDAYRQLTPTEFRDAWTMLEVDGFIVPDGRPFSECDHCPDRHARYQLSRRGQDRLNELQSTWTYQSVDQCWDPIP